MTTNLPTITRTTLANGKFRYTMDGVVHTAASVREYGYASVYVGADGTPVAWLHARHELAVKGSPDANRIGYKRLGTVTITPLVPLAHVPVGSPFTVPNAGGLTDAGVLVVAGPVGADMRVPTTDGRRLQAGLPVATPR